MSCIEVGWQSSDSRIMSGDWRYGCTYGVLISVHEHIPLAIYCIYMMGVSIFCTLIQFIAVNTFLDFCRFHVTIPFEETSDFTTSIDNK